jgi:hypothetical protein
MPGRSLMLVTNGTYRIVGSTQEISQDKLKQIADILGIKDLSKFRSVTIEFVEKERLPSEKPK